MRKVAIKMDTGVFEASLYDTETAQKLWENLPVEGKAQIWGKEIYFPLTMNASLEQDAREEVEVGDLAYWPSGNAFCIFYGPTPASNSEKPKGIDKVNVLGQLETSVQELEEIEPGMKIRIEEAGK